jgi:hypothetical protein
MDIKDFTYRTTPIKKTREYEVHTLSQDGLNQYLDKNSYVHKFLKNLSPYRSTSNEFNQIKTYCPDINAKSKVQEYGSDKFLKEAKDLNNKRSDKGSVITINVNNFHKNIYYKPLSNSNNNEKSDQIKNESYSENNNINEFNSYNNQNYENENGILAKQSSEKLILDNKKSIEENNYANFDYKHKKKTFLQTSKNLLFSQNRFSPNKNNNPLKQKGYLSPKYSEDYNCAISNLKEDLLNNSPNNNITSKNIFTRNKFPIGNFKSYEVPHLEYKRNSSNFRINLIRKKLENTLSKTGKNNNENPHNNEDLDSINKNIEFENLKLKNYFENINKFTKSDNQKQYPSVSDITNSVNLRTTKLKLSNNKFMGERYDPTNYA